MTIAVCGFGRCGSSMVMQMLDAAGFRCAGKYPAFEVLEPGEAIDSGAYDAVKWLAPSPGTAPKSIGKAIWLDRNAKQQARSVAKFLAHAGKPITPRSERGYREAFVADRSQVIGLLRKLTGGNVLEVRFEDLLAFPSVSSAQIAEFLEDGSPQLMASVIEKRRPECMRGMMEFRQLGRSSDGQG